jgi:hypothetical protein
MRLLMLLPPASSTLRAAQQRSLSEPPLRFHVVPECAVGFRAGVALEAAVPETSIDEDGDPLLGNRGLARWPSDKGEVGFPGQGEMPTPARKFRDV